MSDVLPLLCDCISLQQIILGLKSPVLLRFFEICWISNGCYKVATVFGSIDFYSISDVNHQMLRSRYFNFVFNFWIDIQSLQSNVHNDFSVSDQPGTFISNIRLLLERPVNAQSRIHLAFFVQLQTVYGIDKISDNWVADHKLSSLFQLYALESWALIMQIHRRESKWEDINKNIMKYAFRHFSFYCIYEGQQTI